MGPNLFSTIAPHLSSHRKTRQTMSMDNVGLKGMPLRDLELHGHSSIMSLV